MSWICKIFGHSWSYTGYISSWDSDPYAGTIVPLHGSPCNRKDCHEIYVEGGWP